MNIKKKLKSTVEKIDSAFFTLCRKISYTTLVDMNFKMSRYIDIVVNNKFERLLKIRLPFTKRYLYAIFAILQKEYAELSNNKEYANTERRNEQIMLLARKYEIFRSAGVILSVMPENKDVLDFLDKNNIKGNDRLKRIQGEMKNIEMAISELKALGKKEKKDDNGKITLQDYIDTFAVLNKSGYKADINMSVLEFISAMKKYKQEIKEHNEQAETFKNKRR
jgi:hypothetical protein